PLLVEGRHSRAAGSSLTSVTAIGGFSRTTGRRGCRWASSSMSARSVSEWAFASNRRPGSALTSTSQLACTKLEQRHVPDEWNRRARRRRARPCRLLSQPEASNERLVSLEHVAKSDAVQAFSL